MVEELTKRGLGVLDGCTKGDQEREFTFIGHQGDTVIDYSWVEVENRDWIDSFEITMISGSEHLPQEKVIGTKGMRRGEEGGRSRWREVEDGSLKAVAKYRKKLDELVPKGNYAREGLEEIIAGVNEAMVQKKMKIRERGESNW